MLWRCLNGSALPRVARVEEESGALQAHPVALPAALVCQLDLVLLPQQPLLHGQKSANEKNGFRIMQ